MKLFPCTKQPPCKNVRGHKTPVCPNDTNKNKFSASKLKTEAVLEHEPVVISYHENGKLYYERWESGKGPDGLLYRSYDENGKLYYEEWEPGKGPDGLRFRGYHNNRKLRFEQWELGKGPDGLLYREYDENGKIIEER